MVHGATDQLGVEALGDGLDDPRLRAPCFIDRTLSTTNGGRSAQGVPSFRMPDVWPGARPRRPPGRGHRT
jgi:hypothetical protein